MNITQETMTVNNDLKKVTAKADAVITPLAESWKEVKPEKAETVESGPSNASSPSEASLTGGENRLPKNDADAINKFKPSDEVADESDKETSLSVSIGGTASLVKPPNGSGNADPPGELDGEAGEDAEPDEPDPPSDRQSAGIAQAAPVKQGRKPLHLVRRYRKVNKYIKENIDTVLKVASYIFAMWSEELYKVEYGTFEEWAKAELGNSRQRAYQYLDLEKMVRNAPFITELGLENLHQFLALKDVPVKHYRAIVEEARSKGKVTAKALTLAAAKRVKATGDAGRPKHKGGEATDKEPASTAPKSTDGAYRSDARTKEIKELLAKLEELIHPGYLIFAPNTQLRKIRKQLDAILDRIIMSLAVENRKYTPES